MAGETGTAYFDTIPVKQSDLGNAFNNDTTGWQFASGIFIVPKDYTSLKAHLVYHYNGNPVMFDGIHLYKGNETSI